MRNSGHCSFSTLANYRYGWFTTDSEVNEMRVISIIIDNCDTVFVLGYCDVTNRFSEMLLYCMVFDCQMYDTGRCQNHAFNLTIDSVFYDLAV